ncbi:MAG: mismatch-specific DNA-glycosylase [Nocardioides sp.]|nr:mismatch-specific DNA-glycosylase [Nocardioides sp.]
MVLLVVPEGVTDSEPLAEESVALVGSSLSLLPHAASVVSNNAQEARVPAVRRRSGRGLTWTSLGEKGRTRWQLDDSPTVEVPSGALRWMPMALFTRAELESFRDTEVPDLLGPDLRLLFVGINPGLWTAATQTHFAHPVNRFYPALLQAGIIDRPIDAAAGMVEADRAYFRSRGLGITNLAPRATARADELSAEELRAGGERLVALVTERAPRVVAVAGITAYRRAFGVPKAALGRQPETFGGAVLWVVPNPSGLNAHHTVASLARAYAEPARAAGVLD